MRIEPLYLALAIVLLWLPTALFLGRRRRRELRVPDRESGLTILSLLASVWSWIDLLRAGAGAWILVYLAIRPPLLSGPSTLCSILQVAVLGLGVWSQTMLTGSFRLRLAPLCYLVGLSVALLPWQVSLFGGVLGLTLAAMMSQWIMAFWILPVTLVAASVLFQKTGMLNLLLPAVYLVAAILSVRPERPIAWVYSRKRVDSATPSGTPRDSRSSEAPFDSAARSAKY